uniref:J domain-containing protein n=1 Tax=Electrophorus electricus TaxID=8005 RepID=A0A4W4EJ05_ELEEL
MRPIAQSFFRRLFWLAAVLMLLANAGAASDIDPYKILGVSRHASQAEIKRAYKQLAREWHPDKNKSPGAQDMFIKITKSYEILSNEERRANYDRFGETDENQHRSQAQQGFRHFHESFFFDQTFFHFRQSTRDFADSKHMLHYEQYMNEIVPESFRRPYLIKVTSEWCFSCIHIEPIWKETVLELEALGVGIGVVDIGFEKRLRSLLGAHRPPSILGLVNGRVTSFHRGVVRENLRQFVESLLPQTLVEKVNDNNYLRFLNGWREENKPSVLLFDAAPIVPLLYKLTAFAYRDFVRFGYVEQGHSDTAHVLQQFSINAYAPTLLLFKENPEKPADVIQSRGMKRQLLDEFVSNNRFLLVPRLVNQKFFDELCPVKQFHRRRKYCVLLITGEDEALVSVNAAFYDFASSNSKEVLRFAYVYQSQQKPLCDTFLSKEELSPPQVIILERRSSTGKVLYRTVTGGWNGSDEDKHRLHKQLELLQKDPAYLNYDAMLPELNNELASIFLVQWLNSAYDYLSQMYFDILHSNWREMMPIISLIFSALFILFGTVIVQKGLCDVLLKQNVMINLVEMKISSTTVAYLSQTIHYSFLNVDKHRKWMDLLLAMALGTRHSDMELNEGTSSHEPDYTGYVLALNGHKKYLCLFRPVHVDDKEDSSRSSDEDARAPRAGVKTRSKGSSRRQTSSTPHVCSKLERLSLWMERLMEGSLPRHYVPSWPDLEALQK